MHGDPVLIATVLWAAVHGITSLVVAGNRLPVEDLDTAVDKLREVLLAGLASRD